MSDAVVIFENVHKAYKGKKAVDGVSFSIERGACFGLLGPNGAGKSTLMRLVYGKGRRAPDPPSRVSVLGFDPEKDELSVKCRCGVVPQEDNLDEELNVEQNLFVFARLYGIAHEVARRRVPELLDFMELKEKSRSAVRELSGGMKRRLVIARALLNDPKLLILDEPTTGLDPQVRHVIWDKLRELKRQGLTILLSTHYMEEAFELCEHIVILDEGRVILAGTPHQLLAEQIERYVLEVVRPEAVERVRARVQALGARVRVDASHETMRFYSDDQQALLAATEGLAVVDFRLRNCNLEDVFLRATGRGLNDIQ
ncbi:MAG TPA: ATP-binding cassette domain-containing protein [Polyangiaceae bacterium]|nr:ATP-binding cassette domain-containing protein [Polyangiaceae bacterium]